MDLHERHLGPCAVRDVDTGVVTVAADVLQQNPLLFETCIVQSHELLELPRIIELFGYWGLMALLKSGVLQFQLDPHICPERRPHTRGLKPGESTASLLLDSSSFTGRPSAYNVTVARVGSPPGELVLSELSRLCEPPIALLWLEGVNPHLGDRRPIDVIRSGHAEELLPALRSELAGSPA